MTHLLARTVYKIGFSTKNENKGENGVKVTKMKNSTYEEIRTALLELGNPKKAESSKRFFKTGKGKYGHGDKFIGVTVPEQRAVAKRFVYASLSTIEQLLESEIHEFRLTGLLILVEQFKQTKAKGTKIKEMKQKQIFNFYLAHIDHINNWDLVDLSAPNIIGKYLSDKDKRFLYRLAESSDLWKKRIAIVATYTFIRNGIFEPTLEISEKLLEDKLDLIHKAVGWMLREVGKKDASVLEKFLNKHCKKMPRTMLRYSIERFPEAKRKHFLVCSKA